MAVQLDPQLARDCFVLQEDDFAWILLLNNAAIPWFIIVPKVDADELCDLTEQQQQKLTSLSDQVCHFIRTKYAVDKLNIAAIGNIVRQFHWHIIGRFEDDYCWPGVVWGTAIPSRYSEPEVATIKLELAQYLT